ncbi:MAG: pseudouridine synthase [Betaproteobacteria bacterium]|nr:pseudouridine synthase [Betaproteobacteria bacterium]
MTQPLPYRPPAAGPIAPLYIDDSLIVLDKPSGLLSVPGRGADKVDCLAARVQAVYPDALIVHRLDMATSGLLIMARSPEIHRRLSQAFLKRKVTKRYVALLEGRLEAESGTVDLPLICDWPNRPRQIVDHASGKPSTTHWRVLEYDAENDWTRVELEPITGRSHQLRVHMQALGHPILGDELYASDTGRTRTPRLMLHASFLALAHPAESNHWLEWRCAAPF